MIEKSICELFESVNGNSKYTKTFCSEHIGEYTVYTGTTIGIFAKVDSADFTEPNLTFTTDGEKAGTIELITDNGYCIGGHRTILKPIVANINLLYFKFVLQPIFYANVKRGDVPSLHFNRIKNLKVQVPVLSDGTLDYELQKSLALKYQDLDNKKRILLDKIEKLKRSEIVLSNDELFKYKMLSLNEMFKFERGRIISKTYILENSGDYPVYSTQKGVYGHINTYMKTGEFLLWNTDGLAGYIKKTSGSFSYTNIVGIMIPNKKVDFSMISLDYIKCYLEPIFRSNRKGRMGINGKNEYTKLNSTMIKKLNIQIPIPIKDNGEFDLGKQEEMAQKYDTISSIKTDIYKQVKELIQINVISQE